VAQAYSDKRRRWHKRWIWRLAIYAGLLAVAIVCETPDSFNEVWSSLIGESCHPREVPTLAPPAYNILLRLASEFRPVRVAVVTFGEKSEPEKTSGGRDYCEKRYFTSELIQQIEKLGARSIVLDELYDPGRCVPPLAPGDPDGTAELRKTLANSTIPITFAINSEEIGETAKSKDIKACLIKAGSALKEDCPEGSKQHCVKSGQARLDEDTRRIPMQWQLFAAGADAGTPTTMPALEYSLPLQAAMQQDSELQKDPDPRDTSKVGPVGKLMADEDPVHPFTSFLEDGEIPIYPARQVLCGIQFPAEFSGDWKSECKYPVVEDLKKAAGDCSPLPGGLSDKRIYCDLRDKVVVIGEGEEDEHYSVLGENTLGAVLDANYVQSLLDQRIFVPVPAGVTFLLYLLWFVATNWFFWKPGPHSRFRPEKAWLVAVAGLVVLFVLSWCLAWKYHILIPVWWESSVSLAYITLHWVDERAHWAGEER
jgi:CHASE2 domain-containing sensor protein